MYTYSGVVQVYSNFIPNAKAVVSVTEYLLSYSNNKKVEEKNNKV